MKIFEKNFFLLKFQFQAEEHNEEMVETKKTRRGRSKTPANRTGRSKTPRTGRSKSPRKGRSKTPAKANRQKRRTPSRPGRGGRRRSTSRPRKN